MAAIIRAVEKVVRRRLKKPVPTTEFKDRVVKELQRACGTTGIMGEKPKSLKEIEQRLRDYFRKNGVEISEDELRSGLRDLVEKRIPDRLYSSMIEVWEIEYVDREGNKESRYVIKRYESPADY